MPWKGRPLVCIGHDHGSIHNDISAIHDSIPASYGSQRVDSMDDSPRQTGRTGQAIRLYPVLIHSRFKGL